MSIPFPMPDIPILYEDENCVVINKPAGLLVHPVRLSKKRSRAHRPLMPTVMDWFLRRYGSAVRVGDDPELRPGVVHRLDKETSGVMVLAKTQSYFEYLKSLFQARSVTKTYLALVEGIVKPKQGIIEKSIGIKTGSTKRSVFSARMAKEAITKYKVNRYFHGDDDNDDDEKEKHRLPSHSFSLVEVQPRTGRTHQIRVHFKSIGHPIAGDTLYGSSKSRKANMFSRLMLHAYALELPLGQGRRITVEAVPPEEFQEVIQALSR